MSKEQMEYIRNDLYRIAVKLRLAGKIDAAKAIQAQADMLWEQEES